MDPTNSNETDHAKNPNALFADASTRRLADSIPSMVWTCRSDGHADYLNEKWYSLTGQSPKEALGFGWADTLHPDDRDRAMSEWKLAVDAGRDFEIELRYKLAAGGFHWHLVRAVPVRDDEGGIDHWFGISTDIDDKHESEELSEATTQAIVEAALDAIVTIDNRGTIQSANPATKDIFGYELHEFRGKNISKLMPERYSAGPNSYLATHLETGEQRLIGSDEQIIGTRKDGSEFPMELAVSEIEVRGQRMYTGIVRDITNRRQLENDLRGQARVLKRVANGDSLTDVLMTLIEVAEESRPEMIGSILLLGEKAQCLRHGASLRLPDAYCEAIDGVKPGPAVGSCGTAAFTGEQVIVENIATHPAWKDYRELAEQAGLRACWSEPILSTNGTVLGTFAMYYKAPRTPSQGDLDFVSTSANLAALAIERVAAQNALAEKTALFETIVKGIPDALLMANLDRKITHVNPGACQAFGYDAEELIGQPTSVLYANPAAHAQQGKARFNKDASKLYEVEELNWRRKNGDAFLGELMGTVIHDEAGEPMNYLALIRDVTERKQAQQLAQESQRKLATLISNLPGAAFRCLPDENWTMEYISNGCRELCGYAPEEIMASKPFWLQLVHPDDIEGVTKIVESCISENKPFQVEYRIHHRNGENRWLWEQGQGVFSEEGELLAIEGFVTDFTELKKTRVQLVQSERLAAMGQMMSSIAHESRNALQRIQAGVDMLKLDIPPDSEAGSDLAEIGRGRNDLQTLLEGMRDFAAPVNLELQKCNLADIWRQCWRNLDVLKVDRQATLVEEPADIDLCCHVDSFRIEQVFRNIVENSFAACPDPVVITISTSEVVHKGVPAVSITVRDNGPGLTQEQQERIFDAFYSTKPKGTGLGMAIALKTIKAHQGTFGAGNGENGGAEFAITIPFDQQ